MSWKPSVEQLNTANESAISVEKEKFRSPGQLSKLLLLNISALTIMTESSSNALPRDIGFYEGKLFKRLDESFKIDGPYPMPDSDDTWHVILTPAQFL